MTGPVSRVIVGEVRECLAVLDTSVDCVVTSPPYWGLRDYGVEGQVGMEPTPQEYVVALVAVFQDVRRALADHGTVWLNLGDSYASTAPGTMNAPQPKGSPTNPDQWANWRPETPPGLKPKDLVGIPWRVALALQDDGWYLRSDIIWSKPNVMPESVTDRPTKSHEYVFLLSKQPSYYFDQEAVREPPSGRNVRTVWNVLTDSFEGAHFAVMPRELAQRCIVAGAPKQVCTVCGKARERIVEKGEPVLQDRTWSATGAAQYDDESGKYAPSSTLKHVRSNTTLGWTDCGHNSWRRGLVLDPFLGSGTTALVALREGRDAVGIELNPVYARMAETRLERWWDEVPVTTNPAPEGQTSLLDP